MTNAPMITVTLYSRQGCHLCDEVEDELKALREEHPHRLVVIDIDSAPGLQEKYGIDIPVVEIGPYRLRAPINPVELRMTLGAARDRQTQIDDLDRTELSGLSTTWTAADRFTHWFSHHYVGILNIFVILYLGLPVLAPFLMAAGIEAPARLIYRAYGLVCHQLGFRSYFLFGEQAVYPRADAGIPGLMTFNQATGLGEASTAADLNQARQFIGNPQIGYKIAFCQRDLAIYGGILLFGLLYAITARRIPGIPWFLWLLIGILPIGIDGASQLFSQPPLDFLPLRESTPFLRTLTGFLFGFTTAWFGYPLVEETMGETRRIMTRKLSRVKQAQAAAPQASK